MYLSIALSIYPSIYLCILPSIHPSIYQSVYLSICLPICLSIFQSVDLSIYLSFLSISLPASLKTKQFCETSTIVQLDNIQNEAILGPRRSPQTSQLRTSKTKQFCKTSSVFVFEVDNVKEEAFLRDFLQNGKLSAELRASCRCVLQCVHSICLKYCACRAKVKPGHRKGRAILAKLKIWPSKMQPLSGNQRPDPPTISGEHVFCIAPATQIAPLQTLCKCPTPANVFWNCHETLMSCSLVARCWIPCAYHGHFGHRPSVFNTFGFEICNATSTIAPGIVRFVRFDFEICFALQRQTLFHQLNFQKWSETLSFYSRDFQVCFAHCLDISTSKGGPKLW